MMSVQFKEVRKVLRTTVHVPSESYALFPPVGGVIDHLGVAAVKVTLAYGLEASITYFIVLYAKREKDADWLPCQQPCTMADKSVSIVV